MSIGTEKSEPIADEPTDDELVKQAVAGDYDAFEAIVDRYHDKAYRLAFSLVKDDDEAQDVVQEAFLNVYRKLDTFKGESQFGSWIYRVVVNAALMRLRKVKRRSEIGMEDAGPSISEDEGAFSNRPSWRVHADEAAENLELREQILSAVDELNPKYQAVFILREVEDLSLAEIADVLDLTEGAVKTSLHRARLHLQAALEPYLGRNESIS